MDRQDALSLYRSLKRAGFFKDAVPKFKQGEFTVCTLVDGKTVQVTVPMKVRNRRRDKMINAPVVRIMSDGSNWTIIRSRLEEAVKAIRAVSTALNTQKRKELKNGN